MGADAHLADLMTAMVPCLMVVMVGGVVVGQALVWMPACAAGVAGIAVVCMAVAIIAALPVGHGAEGRCRVFRDPCGGIERGMAAAAGLRHDVPAPMVPPRVRWNGQVVAAVIVGIGAVDDVEALARVVREEVVAVKPGVGVPRGVGAVGDEQDLAIGHQHAHGAGY